MLSEYKISWLFEKLIVIVDFFTVWQKSYILECRNRPTTPNYYRELF